MMILRFRAVGLFTTSLVLAACGADEGFVEGGAVGMAGTAGGSAGSAGASTGGSAGVGTGGGPSAPDGTPPSIDNLAFIENPNNHLSGFLELDTDEPATLSVQVSDGARTFDVPTPRSLSSSHSINVLGFHADASFEITVIAADDSGNSSSRMVSHSTGPLPSDFPPIEVSSDPARMEPGVTFFNVIRWNPTNDDDWGRLLAVDETGRVIWYYTADHGINELRRLSNGNLLYIFREEGAVEIDEMGEEVARWTNATLAIDSIHHEIVEIDSGRFLTLGSELRSIAGYDNGTATHDVVGDTVVEFDRDGNVLTEWSFLDLLDPLRVRPGFDAPFWDETYPEASNGTKDWSHGNAVVYDESDDSMIVSLRHQDWLVKLSRSNGEVIWRLGEGGDFTMMGGGEFPFHAHAPEIQPDGGLLVFDNGNARSTLMGQPAFSRVVELQLDTTGAPGTWTVEQVWEYRGESSYFAPFLGDADRLANGNTLITDGGLVSDEALQIGDPLNIKTARIVEVTSGASPEVVFQLGIADTAATPVGYSVYRAERLPSLYPD